MSCSEVVQDITGYQKLCLEATDTNNHRHHDTMVRDSPDWATSIWITSSATHLFPSGRPGSKYKVMQQYVMQDRVVDQPETLPLKGGPTRQQDSLRLALTWQ